MELAPTKAGFSAERLNRITDFIDRNYIQNGKIAGAQALVTRHGYVSYFKSFGKADLERGAAMRDDAIFRIYSMSKPITSVALMQLYERGLFQLNDPVSRFVPSWKKHKVWVSGEGDAMELVDPVRPMTMRNVLNHSGGLTYGSAVGDTAHPVDKEYKRAGINWQAKDDLATFLDKLSNVPLRYQPGEAWLYSYSTDVCGALVEVLSGQRYDEYLQEHIFGPLGMVDTSFWVRPEKLERFTTNYSRRPDKTLQVVDDPQASTYAKDPVFKSGGGGLTSTMADYLRFCEMLRRGGELDDGGHGILGPRTLELMHQNHLPGGQDLTQFALGSFSETANEGVGFGLGFAKVLDRVASGSIAAGDYYWGGAASTIFWIDPVEDLAVIFLTQLMPSSTFNFRGQLKNIVYSSIVE